MKVIKTRFAPSVDGVSLPYALDIDEKFRQQILLHYQESFEDCLDLLKKDFGEIINHYQLIPTFEKWTAQKTTDFSILSIGSILLTLDYFKSKILPNDNLRKPLSLSNDSKITLAYRNELRQRVSGSLSLIAARILQWSTVSHLLPVKVLPEIIIKEQILSAGKRWLEPAKTEIEFNYTHPSTGSYPWLHQQTQLEWLKVKEKLDQGIPCAVILFNRTSVLSSHLCVLAYAYEMLDSNRVLITVFNSLEPKKHHQISVDFSGDKVGILTTLKHPGNETLQGFIYFRHDKKKPPLLLRREILRYALIPQLKWWIKRLWQ